MLWRTLNRARREGPRLSADALICRRRGAADQGVGESGLLADRRVVCDSLAETRQVRLDDGAGGINLRVE